MSKRNGKIGHIDLMYGLEFSEWMFGYILFATNFIYTCLICKFAFNSEFSSCKVVLINLLIVFSYRVYEHSADYTEVFSPIIRCNTFPYISVYVS